MFAFETVMVHQFPFDISEIGKAKQAYGPMALGFQKLWAISKNYGPWQ